MKYVEIYIKSLTKKQAQSTMTLSPRMFKLPGLRSAKDLAADEIRKLKREYNLSLRGYQRNVRICKSLSGKEKKEMKQHLQSTREHLDSMLIKIGEHTPSERVSGFEGVNDAE
ncbi:MAG: hypothetical protein NTV54_00180 [Ignavibacteriales bacterium]|nr:hypothetical protein [Ignavibacteriales bacterium]